MRSGWKALFFLTVVAMVLAVVVNSSGVFAAPGAVPPGLPPPPTEPVPTKKPPRPSDGGVSGGGGGGGSRFLHCNSTVSGFVTNYADKSPGAGTLVEIGNSGWKNQMPADSNGYFYFGGLCEGIAYVKVLVPEGGLPTHPNAEAVLDGQNQVQVDLGYFPPAPQAEFLGGEESAPSPTPITIAVPQVGPTVLIVPRSTPETASSSKPIPVLKREAEGVTVKLSAPRTVRAGMAGQVAISVKNGGPGKAANTVVTLPLSADLMLQEADTSRGALKVQPASQTSETKILSLSNAGKSRDSDLVVNVGTLAPQEAALIVTKISFKESISPGAQAQLQAEVMTEGKSYTSEAIGLTLEETGGAFQINLPTTGANTYLQYFRNLLW